jgi:uncharacterized protein (DUF58 family)
VTGPPHRGRPDVRPSPRALLNSCLVVGGLVGLAVLTGDVWLLLLACLAVGALVVDALLPLPGACLHVGIEGPVRTQVGDRTQLGLAIRNAGTRPSRPCVLRIRTPVLDVAEVHLASMQPGERADLAVPARVIRRGAVSSVEVELVKGGVLGLLTWSGLGTRQVEIVAVPAPAEAWSVLDRAGMAPSPGGRMVVRPGGIEVHGVRDWRPGDPSRHVHWRSTARRGRLVVTDRFDEVGGDLVLIIVPPLGGPGYPDPDWEATVSRIAATADVTLAAGGSVSLVAQIVGIPDLQTRNSEAVLDWCARLPAADSALPRGDEVGAMDRAWRASGPGGQPLVVATPSRTAVAR